MFDSYRVIDLVNCFQRDTKTTEQEQQDALILASKLLSDCDSISTCPLSKRQYYLLRKMLQSASQIPSLFQPHTLVDLVWTLPNRKTPIFSPQLLSLLLLNVSWISFPPLHSVYTIATTILDFYAKMTHESIILCEDEIPKPFLVETSDLLNQHFYSVVMNQSLSKQLFKLFPNEWIRFSGLFLNQGRQDYVHEMSALLSKLTGEVNPFLTIT
jgi:hypothetical protein